MPTQETENARLAKGLFTEFPLFTVTLSSGMDSTPRIFPSVLQHGEQNDQRNDETKYTSSSMFLYPKKDACQRKDGER